MSEKTYNLAVVFLTYSLWPVLGIVAIILFRTQIKAILTNIGGASSVKLNSPVLNIEATTSVTLQNQENNDEASEPLENTNKNIQISSDDNSENSWFKHVNDLFEKGKHIEASEYFYNFIKNKNGSVDYPKEHAFFLYLQYTYILSSDVLKEITSCIEQTNDIEKRSIYINSYISCLDHTKQYRKAISFLEAQINSIHELKNKAHLTLRLSYLYAEDSELVKAQDIITRLISDIDKNPYPDMDIHMSDAYNRLSKIEKSKGNEFNCALCLDKAVEYSPSDIDTMFTAAYESSTVELSALEVSNYETLISLDAKNDTAINNMGVTAGTFDLKLTSGGYYTDAKNLGNTLAMSNIGYSLLSVGLYSQAEDIVQLALSITNPHDNIHKLKSQITIKKDDESKRWELIKKQAKEKQRAIRKYTYEYYSKKLPFPLGQHWVDDEGVKVSIQQENNNIKITWESESKTIELNGSSHNMTFKGKYSSRLIESRRSILNYGEKDINLDCLGYYNETDDSIIVISTQADNEFSAILKRCN
ncbi:TPA: tetratricopeptide repeat protein [Klebsiella aerogenes]|nr:tetratricopeptide repeat protein [Klebsiella aerogenes]